MTISRYKSFACEILRINRSDKVLGISYSDFCISKFIGLEVECTDLTDLSLTCEVVFQRPLVKGGEIHQKEMGISDGQSHFKERTACQTAPVDAPCSASVELDGREGV